MKTIKGFLVLTALVFAAPAAARTKIIVLPPGNFSSELRTELAQAVVGLAAGDRLLIYASKPVLAPIASVTRLADPTLNKARVNAALAAQFKPVLDYMAAAPPVSVSDQQPLIPQIVEQLASEVPSFAEGADILLAGISWFYQDLRELRTAFVERAVPADSTLYAPRSLWPYSVAGAETRLARSALFMCWPDGANRFDSDRYQYAITRWWRVWAQAQSGKVGTMSFSLKTCFARFNTGDTSGQPEYTIQRDGKPEMQRVSEAIPLVLPVSFDTPGLYFMRDDMPLSRTPPTITKGVVWVGATWSGTGSACDVDLYSRANAQSPWLYYASTKTPEGAFGGRDWQSAPGDQYEFIMFNPVELGSIEIALNLYSCSASAPPEGKLRIWFAGRVWEMPFKFGARTGNKGAQPMAGGQWVRFTASKIVGLAKE